jgi:hypothetical protein
MPSAVPLGPQDLQTTQGEMSDYYRVLPISTRQADTGILLAQRLVLADQFVALRQHVLYLVVVLGEGTIELGLQHGRVLPGLVEFLFQRFRPEHCIAIPLEHIEFLSGSLHDIVHNATNITWVLNSSGTRLLKGIVTYLHPLLSPVHQLQVAGC